MTGASEYTAAAEDSAVLGWFTYLVEQVGYHAYFDVKPEISALEMLNEVSKTVTFVTRNRNIYYIKSPFLSYEAAMMVVFNALAAIIADNSGYLDEPFFVVFGEVGVLIEHMQRDGIEMLMRLP